MTEYYIPTEAAEAELVEKRSRFIGEDLGQPDAGSGVRQTEERSRKIWNKG